MSISPIELKILRSTYIIYFEFLQNSKKKISKILFIFIKSSIKQLITLFKNNSSDNFSAKKMKTMYRTIAYQETIHNIFLKKNDNSSKLTVAIHIATPCLCHNRIILNLTECLIIKLRDTKKKN